MGTGLFKKRDPRTNKVAIVMVGSSADEVSIDDTGFIDENAPADFEIEPALWHSGHPPASDAVREGRNFDPVTHAADWFVFVKEVPGHSDEILVVADIFGGASATEEDAQIIGRVDLAEGDISVYGISFPFPGDGPAWWNLVKDHLVAAFFWSGDHRLEAALDKTVVGVESVDGFSGVTDDDEDLGHGVSGEASGSVQEPV